MNWEVFNLQFSIFISCSLSLALTLRPSPFSLCRSKRLCETKLNLALVQTIDCGERGIGVQSLRNQKLRRIQKESVINRQRAAEWRLDSRAYAHGVRPTLSQILGIDVFQKISAADDRFRMKDIAGATKHIAAIVERNYLQISGDWHASFQVCYHQSIAADRHSKGIDRN